MSLSSKCQCIIYLILLKKLFESIPAATCATRVFECDRHFNKTKHFIPRSLLTVRACAPATAYPCNRYANTVAADNTAQAIEAAATGKIPTSYATRYGSFQADAAAAGCVNCLYW